jgi:enolase-phosphatase E1
MSFNLSSEHIHGILLDVEGTTTPIDFVYGTLFPYVKEHLDNFFKNNSSDTEVSEIVRALKLDHENEARVDLMTPQWKEPPIEFVNWLMDRDRKLTALKALQGRIWFDGYKSGKLKGQVFPDVPPALQRWHEKKMDVRIFSSGSRLAQRLLFSTTPEGDLGRWIKDYFDTNVGAKIDAASYTAISNAFQLKQNQILFVSDVTRELDAARQSGMKTLLCMRPGNPPQVMHDDHKPITSFMEIAE